jgi:sucrose-6-phosphate hydrolase SacC (GH32 family)
MAGGKYPKMPFNQQMSFPCEMTLRTFPEGLRICRQPVKEIATIHGKEHAWSDLTLKPGENPLAKLSGELLDIRAEFELGDAPEFGLNARGQAIAYSVKDKTVTCLGKQGPLEPVGNRIRLHVLVDRSSIEVFGSDGELSMTSCFLPRSKNKSLELFANGGSVKVVSLTVYELRSAWRK